jgi:signal transduction histidine kinase
VYVAVVLLGVVTLAPWEEARRWWVISLLFYTIGSIVLAVVSTGGARHGLTMLVVVLSLYGAAMLCARILVRDHQEALHEAHAANAAKSRFLANMSHELRTPLNAVLGYVELVQEAPDQTIRSAEADLDRVHVSATHLLGLINSVLDLAKVEAGRLEVRMGPTDVHRLLVQTVETLLPQAEAKGLSLTLVSAPMEIRSDTAMLKQVVLNLLSNAVKFTDAGQVTVQAERTEGVLVIQIRDTGVGIAADRLEDIFQAFERTQAEVTTRVGGTGLGLAISRRLADVLGGTLDVESVVGEGTCFTLEIPA